MEGIVDDVQPRSQGPLSTSRERTLGTRLDDVKIHNYDVICDDITGKQIVTRFLLIINDYQKHVKYMEQPSNHVLILLSMLTLN